MLDDERGVARIGTAAAVRILILSSAAALLWLVFGMAGTASADESPDPQPLAAVAGLVGDVSAAILPAPAEPVDYVPVASVPMPTAPVLGVVPSFAESMPHPAHRIVAVVPIDGVLAAVIPIVTITEPPTSLVDELLGSTALDPGVSAPIGSAEPGTTAVTSASDGALAGNPAAIVDQPGMPVSRSAPDSPVPPASPSAPCASGSGCGTPRSGAPGASATRAGGFGSICGIRGLSALPQNDAVPSSVLPEPGSSPD